MTPVKSVLGIKHRTPEQRKDMIKQLHRSIQRANDVRDLNSSHGDAVKIKISRPGASLEKIFSDFDDTLAKVDSFDENKTLSDVAEYVRMSDWVRSSPRELLSRKATLKVQCDYGLVGGFVVGLTAIEPGDSPIEMKLRHIAFSKFERKENAWLAMQILTEAIEFGTFGVIS